MLNQLMVAVLTCGTLSSPYISQEEARVDSLESEVAALSGRVDRMRGLQSRVNSLEGKIEDTATTGLLAFLYAAFCALWAQNTRRSALLWFVMGGLLGPFTVLVLLSKNLSRGKKPDPRRDISGRSIST